MMKHSPYITTAHEAIHNTVGCLSGTRGLRHALLVTLILAAATLANQSVLAEQAPSSGGTLTAGTHAYEKSWHTVSPRRGNVQKPAASDKEGAPTREGNVSKRVNARFSCHPEKSKCWRK